MKRKETYILSEVADSHILVAVGKDTLNFNGIVSLNRLGVEIWNWLCEDVDERTLVEKITSEYAVSEEHAAKDLKVFLDTLRSAHCLEE